MKKFFISVLVSLLVIVMGGVMGGLYLFHSLSTVPSSVQPTVTTLEQPSSMNVSASDSSTTNTQAEVQSTDEAANKDAAGSLQQQGLSIGQSFLRWALDAPGVDPMTTAAPAQAEPSPQDQQQPAQPSEEK